MQLIIIWHNCSRPRTEKVKVEHEMQIYVLDAFVSLEKAFHAYNVHYQIARDHPNTEWNRILGNAFKTATAKLSPWEQTNTCATAKFIP